MSTWITLSIGHVNLFHVALILGNERALPRGVRGLMSNVLPETPIRAPESAPGQLAWHGIACVILETECADCGSRVLRCRDEAGDLSPLLDLLGVVPRRAELQGIAHRCDRFRLGPVSLLMTTAEGII